MSENQGEIIVVLESSEKHYSYDQLGLTFESSDEDVLKTLQPVILEETGINILEDDGEELYTIKSIEESKTKYIFPKVQRGKPSPKQKNGRVKTQLYLVRTLKSELSHR